jgi:hypothetical protein
MKHLSIAAAVLLGSALSTASAQITSTRPPLPTTKQVPDPKAVPKKGDGANYMGPKSVPGPSNQSVGTKGNGVNSRAPKSGPGNQFVGTNDSCATPITVVGLGTFPFDNVGATTDGTACAFIGADIWYTWVAPSTGSVVVSLCGGTTFDTVLAVYNGVGCPTPGTWIACNDTFCGSDQSQVTFAATLGNSYTIQLAGYAGLTGTGTFSISGPPPPPPNDSCSAPSTVVGYGSFPFSDVGATTDGTNCSLGTGDVWFTWVAPGTGSSTVSLCGGSTLDSVLAVYNGVGCPVPGSWITCNDDFCGLQSQISFAATAGNSYTIQLCGWNGGTGSGTFAISGPPPPVLNDSCSSPTTVVGGGPFPWTTVGATTDGGAESCGSANHDVWYNWMAPSTGSVVFSLCGGGGGDTVIAVYNGAGCPTPGTAIACNDDSCGLVSQTSFSAVIGNIYTLRIGGFSASTGSGTFTLAAPPPPPANDLCGTPTVIAGLGSFPFNNSSATTGTQGQAESICFFFGSTVIDHDTWYTWNAPTSGTACIFLCGQTGVDTKLAVYNGAGCPTGSAVACNDDTCNFQSQVSFTATAGNDYTIQLGTFPGAAGGSGTFTIGLSPVLTGCAYDDGSTENLVGINANGEIAWLHKFGAAGELKKITSISTAWGGLAFPGLTPPNGSPASIAVWDDPNDDGNPTDAVLLELVATTVQNVDTDILNTVNLPTPVWVSGVYFVGAGVVTVPGQFPAPLDQTCVSSGGRAWAVAQTPGTLNYGNLGANNVPPLELDSIGLPGVWLLRADCGPAFTITPFCFGDGTGHACPCGNTGLPGYGCDNSIGTGGGLLAATGNALISADTVVLTASNERPAAFSMFWQGHLAAARVFGDGVGCMGPALKRMYFGNAVAGSISKPGGGDLSISARSAALGDPLAPGTTRVYHVIYRDPDPLFCPFPLGATFNITGGMEIEWGP